MKIIDTILQSAHFDNKPPVLLDIGASGEINAKWKPIAKYSICIAFDADEREFQITEQVNKSYKKLISINRIVTVDSVSKTDFYLTNSPFCSSLLEPDLDKLTPWLFRPLFEISNVTKLPAITLTDALRDTGISYVDWFKTDTQGTDLRIYLSLPPAIKSCLLATEFEPGIMDAYKGEDKLHMIMAAMSQQGYWLSSMKVKGTQRLHIRYAHELGDFVSQRVVKTSPCWAEICYLKQESADERSLLLLYVFAILEKQYGFALEIADHALQLFEDSLFKDCKNEMLKKIRLEKNKIPLVLIKRKFNKLFKHIND